MSTQHDPHKSYLDTVFHRVNRLRSIDAGDLIGRFGIDPAALPAVDGDAGDSWPASRLLVHADAQREELREHLVSLQRAYVAEGSDEASAVIKAQQSLGAPELLAQEMLPAAARQSLGLDERILSLLKQDNAFAALCVFSCLPLLTIPLHSQAAVLLSLISCGTICYASLSGYAHGRSISPELSLEMKKTAENLRAMLELPTVRRLSPQQKRARSHARRVALQLKRTVGVSSLSGLSGTSAWRQLVLGVIGTGIYTGGAVILMGAVSALVPLFGPCFIAILFSFSHDIGVVLGARRRADHSALRAS